MSAPTRARQELTHALQTAKKAANQTTVRQKAAETARQFPADPAKRLAQAERAFRDADYPLLRPLLQPTLLPQSQFKQRELELNARTLLGVGLYFEAQQVTDAVRRNKLLDDASAQFLELLRTDPFYNLNPLIYPASVVELFAALKAEHSAELDLRRAELGGEDDAGKQGLQTVYIEREIDNFSYAVNFLPFGLGQFQNVEPVQGTLFASSQVLALGLNIGSYWMVEHLRSSVDGKYEAGRGNSAEQARNWQTTQYIGLAAFAGLYIWSVIDALVDYRPYQVRIRTLDEPPPELSSDAPEARGTEQNFTELKMGWNGIGIAW